MTEAAKASEWTRTGEPYIPEQHMQSGNYPLTPFWNIPEVRLRGPGWLLLLDINVWNVSVSWAQAHTLQEVLSCLM